MFEVDAIASVAALVRIAVRFCPVEKQNKMFAAICATLKKYGWTHPEAFWGVKPDQDPVPEIAVLCRQDKKDEVLLDFYEANPYVKPHVKRKYRKRHKQKKTDDSL